MSGYTRNDVTDQIANNNIIDALPLDGEFDAIQTAFAAVGGHRHNGLVGEGAPITVVGPVQDIIVTSNSLTPKTDNVVDLGSPTFEFKNMYIDGVANIDSLVADTADINGGTVDATVIGATTPAAITGTTITGTSLVGPLTGNVTGNVTGDVTGSVTGNASTATILQTTRNIALSGDVTGTIGFNGGANVTIAATVVDNSHNHTLSTITNAGTMASQNANAVAITGGSVVGITDLAVADGGTGSSTAAGALVNFGLTATAAEINNLDAVNTAGHFGLVPSGGIIMWSGSVASIPSGWLLCNGTGGTPNLQDRFIVGAGSSYAVGATGGAAAVSLSAGQLGAHSHSFSTTTGSAGVHTHSTGSGSTVITPNGVGGGFGGGSLYAGNSAALILDSGNHTHTVSGVTDASGSGTAHENRPPYYALAYIMKS